MNSDDAIMALAAQLKDITESEGVAIVLIRNGQVEVFARFTGPGSSEEFKQMGALVTEAFDRCAAANRKNQAN